MQTLHENICRGHISIPLSKLGSTCNCNGANSCKCKKASCNCQSENNGQLMIVPQCISKCCCNHGSNNKFNNVSQVVKQLEGLYQEDLKNLKGQIKKLEDQLKIQREYIQKNQKIIIQNKAQSSDEIKKLESQIQTLKKGKQVIMRSKILDFKTDGFRNREQYDHSLLRLEDQYRLNLTNIKEQYQYEILRYHQAYQRQLKQKEQIINELKIQLKRQIEQSLNLKKWMEIQWKKQKESSGFVKHLQDQMYKVTTKIQMVNKQKQTKQQQNKKYTQNMSKQIDLLKSGLLQKNQLLKKVNLQLDLLKNQTIKNLQSRIQILLNQKNSIKSQWQNLSLKNQGLMKQLMQKTQKLQIMNQNYTNLQMEIKKVNQQKNKISQKKIQESANSNIYISSIQVESQKRQIFSLKLQITKIVEQTKQKSLLIQSLYKEIERLSIINKQLMIYIQDKQRTFAWRIQRQLQIDMKRNLTNTDRSERIYRNGFIFNRQSLLGQRSVSQNKSTKQKFVLQPKFFREELR